MQSTVVAPDEPKRPYRVLLVDLTPGFGGVEMRVLLMAQLLQAHTTACHVAVTEGSSLHQRLVAHNLPCIPITGALKDARLGWKLWQLMARGDYDIVDCHNVPSMLWGHPAALMAGIKARVTTIHSFYEREYTGFKGEIYARVLAMTRWLTKHYVVVAEGLKQQYIERGDGAKTTLIQNRMLPPSDTSQRKHQALLDAWNCQHDDILVAIIGRLTEVKGHTYLLQALAQLPDLPQLKVIVVGDGGLHASLAAQAEQLGIQHKVHFAGFQSDMHPIFQTIDCVCMPSLSEGNPYVVLEAAMYQLPIIGSDISGLRSLLTNGKTAYLVPLQDPPALAQALRWLVEQPAQAQAMAHAAHDSLKVWLDVESFVKDTLRVYDHVI